MTPRARGARWAVALLALAGVGCPGQPPEVCLVGAPSPTTPPRMFAVDEEAVVPAVATLPVDCGTTSLTPNTLPESVTVTLTDPDNLPVEATVELTPDRTGATVRFTPTRLGRHHAIVAFAPVGSLHQFDVQVAENGRDRPELARLTPGRECLYLDRTRRGTWVCDDVALKATPNTHQDLGAFGESSTKVAGDVVWTVSSEGSVRRYVDAGASGGLTLTGTSPLPPNALSNQEAFARLATEDEYLLLTPRRLYRYTFTPEQGVQAAPSTSWVKEDTGNASQVALRAGATLWLMHSTSTSSPPNLGTHVCPFVLGPSGGYVARPDPGCYDLTGVPLAFEEDVVWTWETQSRGEQMPVHVLYRYVATETGMVRQGIVQFETQLSLYPGSLRYGTTLPLVANPAGQGPFATVRWNPSTQGVTFVLHPKSSSAGIAPRASSHFVWGPSPDNPSELSVYPWPPPP
ncbi:hypothetical protein LZ198_13130 [Myxococcus sp. K15C18031901]|uniref:hypothetical protein n=1 Tax=Myxococcus dinghuensis TaxID=2906761 RepID=UPI0020A6F0A1|nr:hypothetical protein [Myxococcus dinghuensis]MCP3099811.1 hypothetical protein [Myxococcus dinghuensis]